jgi:Lanthionine-containing peptide SapB precursor RamS
MALLDLQSMEEPEETRGLAAKSSASHNCNNSTLLSLLCG